MSHHLDFLSDLSRPDELFPEHHQSQQHLHQSPLYFMPAEPSVRCSVDHHFLNQQQDLMSPPSLHNIPPPAMTNLPPPPQTNDLYSSLSASGGMGANSLPLPSVSPTALTNSGPISAPKEKLLPKRARPPKKVSDDEEEEEPVPKKARKNSPKKGEDGTNGQKEEEEYQVDVTWPAQSVEVDSDDNTHYDSVMMNGVNYHVGDVVSLWHEDWEHHKDGPIGEIISLVTDGADNFVELKWFYNVAETSLRGQKRKQHNPRELFLSDHIEEQALEAIARKVTMKRISDIPNLDEYCKQDGCYFYSRKWNFENLDFEDL